VLFLCVVRVPAFGLAWESASFLAQFMFFPLLVSLREAVVEKGGERRA
jgi:hypothetical protein